MRRLCIVSLAALVAACGPKPKPLRFADSQAFAEVSQSVHGILQADFDGDGLDDAIALERSEFGFAPAVYRQVRAEPQNRFERVCQGSVIPGEDLDAFRWVQMGERRLAFVLTLRENPEDLVQHIGLIDAHQGCETVFATRVDLQATDAERVLAPSTLRGGARMSEAGDTLTIIDTPKYLRLRGSDGPVDVLRQVRVQRLSGTALEREEGTVTLLRPVPLRATRGEGGEAPVELSELVDDDDASALALRADEELTLRLESTTPLVLLAIHHGCERGAASLIELESNGKSVRLDAPLPPDAFILGVGSSHVREGVSRDLVALRTPSAQLDLKLTGQVCLRELLAYGFVHTDGPVDRGGPSKASTSSQARH